MANNKRRTTMAKLNREMRLRERRDEKEMRKAARKLEADDGRTPEERWATAEDTANAPSQHSA